MPAHQLPDDLLDGRVVFLSGGGSGVNLGIARVLADLGADLSLYGRTASRLDEAAEELRGRGARVVTTAGDVRSAEQVAHAFERTEAGLGPVDGVVCGAAGNFVAPAESISSNGFRAVVDIDLIGSFHCAHAAFDQLTRTRGSVLFVTGAQSAGAFAHQAHVGAAKAGVDQLMRTLAVEWGPHGIRSNSLLPGPVHDTEGMRRLAEGGSAPWTDSVPLGRFADAEEVGRMAAVLLSPLAAYVTGTVVHIDGGLALSGPALVNRTVLAPAPRV
ncbi:SDR family oxidoreductase [Pseudonocardia sp. ICBG601]|uniref:SDR family oxidoreductase n=1 Tax=Pseudonocardia sp. ICBG601 TaxID=2846759 RepID=UPI001CF7179F|nr:SDR family oxidoreductase [Pseudonocardia sp. ICBG601]